MIEEVQELVCAAHDLLVFIDDTGHEAFAGNQPYYGLGGCVVRGDAYGYLKALWADVRARINGSADRPLHAASMERAAENFAVLARFFADRAFVRVAVASSRDAALPEGMNPAAPVMGALKEDLARLASRIPCDAITIIVESSQRADPILRQHFDDLTPEGAEIAIPVNYCLMPKCGAEPGLEIADFIINAAGSQVKRKMRGENEFARDFNDVFGRLPPCGCLFSIIRAVEVEQDGRVSVLRDRLVGN